MEARVKQVVVGGHRALNSAHGSGGVDGSARKFLQQQQPLHNKPQPSSVHQQAQIGTVNQLLAGGIAGAFSKTCTAPLARLTILFQRGKGSTGFSTRSQPHRMPTMSIKEAGLRETKIMKKWQETNAKLLEEANSSWHNDNMKLRLGEEDDEDDDDAAQDKARDLPKLRANLLVNQSHS